MTEMTANNFVLGTAQIGMPYGIANRAGQPDLKMAENIIQTAWDGGIREFDTAQAYGQSEAVLGNVLTKLKISNRAKIITKLSPEINSNFSADIRNAVLLSLKKLKVKKLHGLLLHREKELHDLPSGLGEALTDLQNEALVEHIGVSVSNPEYALKALKHSCISIIQLPTNILDRRFENFGFFRQDGESEKSIYIRSVFLQGLLLLNPERLPEPMRFAASVLKEFSRLADQMRLLKHELAIGFVLKAYPAAKIVFGAETAQQVRENLQALEKSNIDSDVLVREARRLFSDVEDNILNPALWPG